MVVAVEDASLTAPEVEVDEVENHGRTEDVVVLAVTCDLVSTSNDHLEEPQVELVLAASKDVFEDA